VELFANSIEEKNSGSSGFAGRREKVFPEHPVLPQNSRLVSRKI
jgi:hypothetical protein